MIHSPETELAETSRAEEDARLVLLASAAAEGDEGAFAELYELLSPRVFNLVLRSVRDRGTAEDVCQEIWLRVHKEIRGLRAPEAIRSWLYRIASHACVDFARSSRGRHRNDESEIDEFIVAFGREPEETAILGSEVRPVWQTLGAMAPRQSIALYLKQVDGLSYDEIAEVLECTRPTVEALLFRARQSFVRAYHRVESSPAERCEMFSQVMAGVIDGEPTALQRSALEAHAADCASCRPQLLDIQKATNAYLALPLLPLGKALTLEVILAGGGATAGAGIFTAAAGLFGAGASKIILAGAIVATAAGAGVVTGQVDVPVVSDHIAIFDSRTEDETAASTRLDNDPDGGGAEDRALLAATAESIAMILGGNSGSSAPAANVARSPENASGGQRAAGSQDAPASEDEEGTVAAVDAAGAPTGSDTEGGAPGAVAAPSGPVESVVTGLKETAEELTTFIGGTLEELGIAAGDTVAAVVRPVGTVLAPVDTVVEDLTGISVNETLEDVTNLLPSSEGTPVPLDETVEDIVEPVAGLLEDPLAPVEEVLEDPLQTVEDLTEPVEDLTDPLLDPLLNPLLGGGTPEPPAGTPAPDATMPPSEEPCLLGLLLC